MLTVAWIVCVSGWIIVYNLPDQYMASARVYVDTSSVLRPLLRGLAIDSNVRGQIVVMERTLLSRPNLEKVTRMTDLDLKAKTPEKMDELIAQLKNGIRIASARTGPNIYTISHEHSDPQLAKKVVQSLLTIFVESTLGASRKDSDTAQKFLEGQIKEYEAKLLEAENRLKEFKRKYVGMMPGSGGEYFSRLETTMGNLEGAKLQLREATNRRDELKNQIEDIDPEDATLSDIDHYTSPLDSRIQALESRLDELLVNYTDLHPEVILTKKQIRRLEAEKLKDIKENEGKATSRQAVNPIYQQMQLTLADAEATVSSLKARVEDAEGKVETMKKMVDTIPQIEAEFKKLNRDYNVHKQNYDTLVSRRESARISSDASETAENVKFKIIDPPFVPKEPSGPHRLLLSTGVLFGGMAGGLGLAVLLFLIKPSFDTRKGLGDAMGLPVLGSVSMIWSPAQIRERKTKIITFGATALSLLLTYFGILTVGLVS